MTPLSEEERNQLQTEVQELEGCIARESKNVQVLKDTYHRALRDSNKIADDIEAAEKCFRILDEAAFEAALKEHPLLEFEFKQLKNNEDPPHALHEFRSQREQRRANLKAEIEQSESKMVAAENKLEELKQDQAAKKAQLQAATDFGHKIQQSLASGLLHLIDGDDILFDLNGSLKHVLLGGEIPDDVPALENFDPLDQVWEIFNGKDNDSLIVDKDDEFIKALLSRVNKLNEILVRLGWQQLKFDYDFNLIEDRGEMLLQQHVYTQFSALFIAAAKKGGLRHSNYKSDQFVTSSLSYLTCTSANDSSPKATRLYVKPDAAVTLVEKGWDPIGVMELKAKACKETREDTVRCVLMTAITALVIKDVVSEENRKNIALPFVLGEGLKCSLLVTTLDEHGVPCIKAVKFPGTDVKAIKIDVSNLSDFERKQLLVATAALLNNTNTLVDDSALKDYRTKLQSRMTRIEKTLTASAHAKNAGGGDRGGGRGGRTQQPRSANLSSIQEAQAAASFGGTFTNVEWAFKNDCLITCDLSSHISSYSSSYSSSSVTKKSDVAGVSRFYFTARKMSSTIASTTEDVFLKVWNEEFEGVRAVECEWMHCKAALCAGVPVAAPVLPEIIRSTSPSGVDHLVFAMEYIHEDPIQSIADLAQLSESLILSVIKLHDDARLLHCDLKPDNIRWRNGVVHLIDFEHAQPISLAVCTPGTKGYQAPEIRHRMPCSVMTDAYSVGRTIMEYLDKLCEDTSLENHTYQLLQNIAKGLTDPIVDSRWSLKQALLEIHSETLTFTTERKKPSSPTTIKKQNHAPPLEHTVDVSPCWNNILSQHKNETGKALLHRRSSQVAQDPELSGTAHEGPSPIIDNSENHDWQNLSMTKGLQSKSKGCNLQYQGKETAAPTMDEDVDTKNALSN